MIFMRKLQSSSSLLLIPDSKCRRVAAQEKEVVHRDLRPGRLGLTPDGEINIANWTPENLLKNGPLSRKGRIRERGTR